MHDLQETEGGAASVHHYQHPLMKSFNASDTTSFSLDTRPSQLSLDNVRRAKGIQNYEAVVVMDGEWTEIWCGQCGRNATIDGATKMPRFFGSVIGLFNHIKSHFNETELKKLAPVFDHIKRRLVSDEDAALMKAGKEPTVAITKRTEDPTKATRDKTTPKKRQIDTTHYGTSVSPGSSVGMSSPSKKQMTGGDGLEKASETMRLKHQTTPVKATQLQLLRSKPMLEDDSIHVDSKPAKRFKLTPYDLDTGSGKLSWNHVRRANSRIEGFETVAYMDGKWTEISCRVCGRNGLYDDELQAPRFFIGVQGLSNHVKTHMPTPESKQDVDKVFKLFARRVVSQKDVQAMKDGKQPEVGIEIRLKGQTSSTQKNTGNKLMGGEGDGSDTPARMSQTSFKL